MAENWFASLITHAEKFDGGIKRLTEIWRYPQHILVGYGADDKKAEDNLKIFESQTTTLKNNLNDDEISRSNYMADMDRFLEESQQMFEDLIQSCNDIRTVLSEYEYVKPEDKSFPIKMPNSETEYSVNSSLIASDVTDDLLEVEFTPDMTWRHKSKTLVS